MRHRRARALVPAVALGALLLAGCDDGDEPGDAQETPVAGEDQAGDDADDADDADTDEEEPAGPVPPPTEPADIAPVPPERSASVDGDTIQVEGDRAAFVLPSGNIACVLNEQTAVCQVQEKTYEPRADFMVEDLAAECSPAEADAMTLREASEAWLCVGHDLRPTAGLEQGGWWGSEIDGETLDVDGEQVAVLPYGQTLAVGQVSCLADEAQGVVCRQPELGRREIVLGRSTYWLRRF